MNFHLEEDQLDEIKSQLMQLKSGHIPMQMSLNVNPILFLPDTHNQIEVIDYDDPDLGSNGLMNLQAVNVSQKVEQQYWTKWQVEEELDNDLSTGVIFLDFYVEQEAEHWGYHLEINSHYDLWHDESFYADQATDQSIQDFNHRYLIEQLKSCLNY